MVIFEGDKQAEFFFAQMQLSYDPKTDHVLWRINSKNSEQLFIILTRRFVKLLWPMLLKALNTTIFKDSTEGKAVDTGERMRQAFQYEAKLAALDDKAAFKEDLLHYPWGKKPLIANAGRLEASANEGGGEAKVFIMVPPYGFCCFASASLCSSLYLGLLKLIEATGWDLVLPHLSDISGPQAEKILH